MRYDKLIRVPDAFDRSIGVMPRGEPKLVVPKFSLHRHLNDLCIRRRIPV